MNFNYVVFGCAALLAGAVGCSSSNNGTGGTEGSDSGSEGGGGGSGGSHDGGGPADAGADSAAASGLAIGTAKGAPLSGAPGDTVTLVVYSTAGDGSLQPVAASDVTWTSPSTVTALDPNDAGAGSTFPKPGAQPTAFFVNNPYRTTHPGVLFIADPGTEANPSVTVTANVTGAGTVSAIIKILPAPVGDPDAGHQLYASTLLCAGCHGDTGGGSVPQTLDDGGEELVDGGPVYLMNGQNYPYPATGLNAAPASGNLASDPAWTAGLMGVATQADINVRGVALRTPMPQWLGANDGHGTINSQDFADIYAWLKTQTQ